MDELLNGITGTIGSSLSNPIVAGSVGAVGGAIAGGVVTAAVIKRKRKKSYKSRTSKSRSRMSSSRRNRKQKQPYTAGKGKDRSHKRIRYTKNNQPYVLMANGKARFIKKSSVSRSRKLKGGRY